jgi:translation initiation factor IF-3
LPYDREIQASHVKVIDQQGKIIHTSALLTAVLSELQAKHTAGQAKLFLVQVSGEAFLHSNQKAGQIGNNGNQRPPWRDKPPTCRLYSRDELRLLREQDEKKSKDLEKQKRSVKELETSWSVEAHDLSFVCKRLQDFLGEGRNVSVIIRRKKRWMVPEPEDVEELLSTLRAAAAEVQGSYEDKSDGTAGMNMILDFKIRDVGATKSGKWKGPVPDKTIRLSWVMGEKQLEAHLKDMRQALRKGKHVAFQIESEEDDEDSKVKNPITAQELISRIRLEAGNVRDAVEILPNMQPDARAAAEESAYETSQPWEMRFEANSKNRTQPRTITFDSGDSNKQLNLKLDWAQGYLDAGLGTRVNMHPDQAEAKKMLGEHGIKFDEVGNLNDYTVLEIQQDTVAAPVQPGPKSVERKSSSIQPDHNQSSQGMENLLAMLDNGKISQSRHR